MRRERGSNYAAVDIGSERGLAWVSTPALIHRPGCSLPEAGVPGRRGTRGPGKSVHCFLRVMSGARPGRNVGEQPWFSSAGCGSSLVPVPTGKCFSWMLLSSGLCQHIPAPSKHPQVRSARVCLASCRQPTRNAYFCKKMELSKVAAGKGQEEARILAGLHGLA